MYEKISNPIKAALLASTLCLTAPVAQAHHAAAPHFDLEKKVSVEGTFTRLKLANPCLLYTSPSPRDATLSRMPSSA